MSVNELRTRIVGIGSALPQNAVTNDDLVKRGIDTSDEWIQTRTGIKQRYIGNDDETTSTLARDAAKMAMADARVNVEDIDLIIVATTSPDKTFPGVGCQIQSQLGCVNATAFDLQAACSGFVYALSVADDMLQNGSNKTALIVGAERFSRLLNWEDRSTCVLFGDGAGAAVVRLEKGQNGILSKQLGSDGHIEALMSNGGVGTTGAAGDVMMNGREVYKNAVRRMSELAPLVLEKAGLSLDDMDWFVPHQANKRILEAVGDNLNIPDEKVVVTVDMHANTSAASIPLALTELKKSGKLKAGQVVVFDAFGAGFTWGAMALRW